MPIWLGVALGGGVGALLRHLLNVLVGERLLTTTWAGYPLATMVVNVVGCFLLGVIIAATHRADADNVWRFAASTGFVGSFTTFSTFVADSAMLGHEGNALRTGVYLAGNLLLGYGAYMLGRMLGQALRA